MRLDKTKVLSVGITVNPKEEILEYIKKFMVHGSWFRGGKKKTSLQTLIVVTPNPEQIVLATTDTHFAKILNGADVAIPDGIGIVLASRMVHGPRFMVHGNKIQHRIPGIEFMMDLVQLAAEQGYAVGLIGGRDGSAVEALKRLQNQFANLKGWAQEGSEIRLKRQAFPREDSGQTSVKRQVIQDQKSDTYDTILDTNEEDINMYIQKLIQRLMKNHTQLVFIGLGAPKQEYFIDALRETWDRRQGNTKNERVPVSEGLSPVPCVFMAVGGSFDIIAGRKPRAPLFLRVIGVEWFWRLVHEPWRWKRQLSLLQFLRLVLEKKLASQGVPLRS